MQFTGTLKKYFPLESGEMTITIKTTTDQIHDIVAMHQKEVVIMPIQEGIPVDRTELLGRALIALEEIKILLEK